MKPMFGLDDSTVSQIHSILGNYEEIEKAVIYGSRAKGNYREGSDIDLTLFGNVGVKTIADVNDALDESLLPYTFDISAYDELKNDKLKEHIDRVGKVFYKREDGGVGLKKGWEEKRLGDLVNLSRGHNPPKSKFVNTPREGFVRFYQIRDGSTQDYAVYVPDSPQLHKVEKHEILMVAYRHVGRVFRGVEGAFNVALCKITNANKKLLDDEYLYRIIPTDFVKGELLKHSERSLIPSMSIEHLREIKIPLPPLPEQKRIVSILDKAFAEISRAKEIAEKNLANAKEVFESYLQSVFAEKGKGWEVKTIAEIAKHSLGKMLDKAKNKGALQPYLRNINVRWFIFDLSDLLQMPFLPEESSKCTAIKGDVLICEGGYPGRAAIWTKDYPIYFQKALHRVRFHEPLHNKWFVYYLYSQDKSGELKQHFSGTGIQHFTGEVLHKFQIPLPPLNELRNAIAKFDSLSTQTKHLESIYKQKLSNLEELKKTILSKAFNGEL